MASTPRIESHQPPVTQAEAGVGWFHHVDSIFKGLGVGSPASRGPGSPSHARHHSVDAITPHMKSLEERIEKIERTPSLQDDLGLGGKALFPPRHNTSSNKVAPSDLDMLFDENASAEDAGQDASKEEEPSEKSKFRAMLGPLWGGPVAPFEDDTIPSWLHSYFSGFTTAHGINRAFDDNNGMCRSIFWVCAFFISFVILVLQLWSSFDDYFSAATTTNIETRDGSNVLPMMTFCNLSPIRCGCEGFYDPEIRDNDEYLARVLPFLCGAVLGYDESFTGDLDASGKRINIQILESARARVDFTKTRAKMTEFTSTLTCDNGVYTKAWFVAAIKEGTLTMQDLMNYAGYHDRGRLVRFCQSKDDVTGDKISCMDDRFWSPTKIDEQFGACHTLNPCHDFPVGQECEEDEDCQSELGPRVVGGKCTSGVCECTLCKAGSDCKIISQLKPGRGEGVRVVMNVAVDQDAQLTSAEKARWVPGGMVHLHSHVNDKNLGGAIMASPGRVTEMVIGRSTFLKKKRFPWTNCYEKSITESTQCENTCLKRVQAEECCGKAIPPLQDGRFPEMTALDPSGTSIGIDSPVLACNILDPALQPCLNKQVQRLSEGTICVDGPATFKASAYWGLLQRTGWYNPDKDSNDDEIPDQEEDMWEIENHCVWKEKNRILPDSGLEESRHGRKCDAVGDASKCKSDTGDEDRRGECRKAYRAYCPGRCDALSYEVVGQSSSLLSETAVQIMANDELAWVSYQASIAPNVQRRWQPRCGRTPNGTYIDTPTCFTTVEAMNLIQKNYAMVTMDYEAFDEQWRWFKSVICQGETNSSSNEMCELLTGRWTQVITIEDKIATDVLLGTVGGNLGMWVGMSIMTILECFELLFYAILSIPFFFFGIRMSFVQKREPDPVEELMDDDVQKVLKNIKTIARKRNVSGATKTPGGPGSSLPGLADVGSSSTEG